VAPAAWGAAPWEVAPWDAARASMKASASRADNQGVLVSMYMTRSPVCVAPDEDLAGVARVMAERSIRAVPVVEDDKLVGLLSRSDLLHALPADVHPFSVEFQAGKQVGVRVAQAMSRDVVTVRPDDPVDVAVAEMDERRLSCVVVVRRDEVVGVLSRSDILRAFRRLVFHEHATRLSLVVPEGVEVAGASTRAGEVLSYAEQRHHSGRLVTVALCAEEREVDALLSSLQDAGARLLHRSAPVAAS